MLGVSPSFAMYYYGENDRVFTSGKLGDNLSLMSAFIASEIADVVVFYFPGFLCWSEWTIEIKEPASPLSENESPR